MPGFYIEIDFFFQKPTAPQADALTSESESETVFKPSPNIGGYTLNTKTARGHNFSAKTVIKPEACMSCGKRYVLLLEFKKYFSFL